MAHIMELHDRYTFQEHVAIVESHDRYTFQEHVPSVMWRHGVLERHWFFIVGVFWFRIVLTDTYFCM
jgi:hypothetical protein